MAIYTISTLERVKEIMQEAYLHPATYHPIIFDLNESIDPNDVEVSISRCEKCWNTIHFKLGDYNEAECPLCSQNMEELVVVQMIVQGSTVVSTNYRPVDTELTRLHAIRGALIEYYECSLQAGINENDDLWDDAEDQVRMAKEALNQAIQLAREKP